MVKLIEEIKNKITEIKILEEKYNEPISKKNRTF
tara:strand:+ start:24915 stop:25016 length:102 start_codon:yes stop_codon:yes gene_type:complete